MSRVLASAPGLAMVLLPITPSLLPGWLAPGEAGAERRAGIWQKVEGAGLDWRGVEGVKAGETIAGSRTWAPARDGSIAASPCAAQRRLIRALRTSGSLHQRINRAVMDG